ncbi:MAG: hypothetical protein IKV37_03150, partial [Prevotella sp.]|nr:hypothetical protein [Prevotella sp.]
YQACLNISQRRREISVGCDEGEAHLPQRSAACCPIIFEGTSKIYILYYFLSFLFNFIALSITFVSNKHKEVA